MLFADNLIYLRDSLQISTSVLVPQAMGGNVTIDPPTARPTKTVKSLLMRSKGVAAPCAHCGQRGPTRPNQQPLFVGRVPPGQQATPVPGPRSSN